MREDKGGVSCPPWLGCVFGCRVRLATMHFYDANICICNCVTILSLGQSSSMNGVDGVYTRIGWCLKLKGLVLPENCS